MKIETEGIYDVNGDEKHFSKTIDTQGWSLDRRLTILQWIYDILAVVVLFAGIGLGLIALQINAENKALREQINQLNTRKTVSLQIECGGDEEEEEPETGSEEEASFLAVSASDS
jgi:hypothetical protein